MDALDQAASYPVQVTLSAQHNTADVAPLTASVGVNARCNSRCNYCWIWKHPVANAPLGDLLLAVDELCNLGVFLISLTGGEPFLHPELAQVIAHIHACNVVSSSTTNGLLLNRARLLPMLEAGLDSIILSLDTIDPGTYAAIRGVPLAPVLKGLAFALEQRRDFPKLTISISCVLSKANADQIVPLVEYCSNLGISVGLQPLHRAFASGHEPAGLTFGEDDLPGARALIGRLVKMKSEGYLINSDVAYLEGFPDFLVYRRLPAGFACTAGFTTISVDYELNVKSCWSMPPVGNLRRDKLGALWRSDVYRGRRAEMLGLRCPMCWYRCHTEHRSAEWLREFLALASEPDPTCQRGAPT